MCHDVVSEARAKELKHMQDHCVFEVVWLREVKSLTPPLAVVRALLASAASRNQTEARHIGLFDFTAAFVHSPIYELIVLILPVGVVQPGQGLLLRRALYGTRKASKLLVKTNSKGLEQR